MSENTILIEICNSNYGAMFYHIVERNHNKVPYWPSM